jgi:hypothetical protein
VPSPSPIALALTACLLAQAGCVRAPLPEPLRRGAELDGEGQSAAALTAYEEAARGCERDDRVCRLSRLRVAETLVRLGRARAAIRAYVELRNWTRDPQTASRAQDRLAELLESRGHGEEALRVSVETMRTFPAEVAAEDSLRRVVRLYTQRRQDGPLLYLLRDLYAALEETALADNLLYAAAEIYARNGREREALGLYDQLATRYARSPLRDDALWRAAQLLERRRAWIEALRRYARLLATRRDALILGSYNSIYLDDAQLRIGLIKLDQLGDTRGAIAAFEELRDDFPSSLLRDDAQWWIAQIHLRAGDLRAACRDLRRLLRDFPDGNQAHRARPLASMTCR